MTDPVKEFYAGHYKELNPAIATLPEKARTRSNIFQVF
jgi:hypothetical protein